MLNWLLSSIPESLLWDHLQWRHRKQNERRWSSVVPIDEDYVERAKRQPIGEDDDIFNDTTVSIDRPKGAVPVGTMGWGDEPATVPEPPPEAPPPIVDLDHLRAIRLAQGDGATINVQGGHDPVDMAAVAVGLRSMDDLRSFQDSAKDDDNNDFEEGDEATLP